MLANKKLVKVLSGVLVMLVLQACQDSKMRDLKDFVKDAYKDKKPEIEPLPVIRPFKGYEYSAANEDDPFSVSNILSGDQVAEQTAIDETRRREPLEEFPLDALSMVGTLQKETTPWVIVKTNKGTVLLATVGNYMGQNNGQVQSISPEKQLVVLSEKVRDTAGRWVTRNVEIKVDEQ